MSATTTGFSIAAVVVILANTALVVAKETSSSLHDAMQAALGHHWTTQGVIVILAFIILGFVFAQLWPKREMNGTRVAFLLAGATIIAGIGLVWFFLFA